MVTRSSISSKGKVKTFFRNIVREGGQHPEQAPKNKKQQEKES